MKRSSGAKIALFTGGILTGIGFVFATWQFHGKPGSFNRHVPYGIMFSSTILLGGVALQSAYEQWESQKFEKENKKAINAVLEQGSLEQYQVQPAYTPIPPTVQQTQQVQYEPQAPIPYPATAYHQTPAPVQPQPVPVQKPAPVVLEEDYWGNGNGNGNGNGHVPIPPAARTKIEPPVLRKPEVRDSHIADPETHPETAQPVSQAQINEGLLAYYVAKLKASTMTQVEMNEYLELMQNMER